MPSLPGNPAGEECGRSRVLSGCAWLLAQLPHDLIASFPPQTDDVVQRVPIKIPGRRQAIVNLLLKLLESVGAKGEGWILEHGNHCATASGFLLAGLLAVLFA